MDVEDCKLESFAKDFLQKEMGMVFPCLFIGTDNVYECSNDMDEEEIADMKEQGSKILKDAGIVHNTIIRADDEFQDLSIDITIIHR